jgi:pimeloyl-ACP methyl ester carboxylesterase
MRESTCNFGPDGSLFGILTTPDEELKVEGAPVAIILSAGIVHRVGPFRLHVSIARQLAELGFSTLRIDLSGLGDSDARKGKFDSEDRARLDVSDAMDFLQENHAAGKFVLIGLCSGAYNAHRVAIVDERVAGGVFLDGIVFRTLGFYLRHHVARLFRPRFWRNAIKRRLADLNKSQFDDGGGSLGESEFFENDLSREEVASEIQAMLRREMQMLFLYTGGYDDVCGRSQFKEMFGLEPNSEQLQVEYYPQAEHTFRLTENRKTVCSRIAEWFVDRFESDKCQKREGSQASKEPLAKLL